MRINNTRRVSLWVRFIYTMTLLFMLLSILLIFFWIEPLGYPPYFFLAASFLLLLILYLRGYQIFEYDSDGEALNFRNSEAFLSAFFPKMKRSSEFPKKKLVGYKVLNLIFKKTLYINISSKRTKTGIAQLSYNITYLRGKEIKDLKQSLNRSLKRNKELAQSV